MLLDAKYMDKLLDYIDSNQGKIITLSKISTTPEKILFHLKYYMDSRWGNMPEITFSEDFQKIKIHKKNEPA